MGKASNKDIGTRRYTDRGLFEIIALPIFFTVSLHVVL